MVLPPAFDRRPGFTIGPSASAQLGPGGESYDPNPDFPPSSPLGLGAVLAQSKQMNPFQRSCFHRNRCRSESRIRDMVTGSAHLAIMSIGQGS